MVVCTSMTVSHHNMLLQYFDMSASISIILTQIMLVKIKESSNMVAIHGSYGCMCSSLRYTLAPHWPKGTFIPAG